MAGGGGASGGGGGGGAASTAQLMGDAKAQVTDNIQQLSELSDRTYADIHAPLPYEDGAAAYGCRVRRLTQPACPPWIDAQARDGAGFR
eukprot:COSAG01_NODE_6889_length_3450_cov_1.742763_4_plen_89_part_00